MKADFAWLWGAEAAPGGYSTSTATRDLPGMLVIACEKLGVTISVGACALVVDASSNVVVANSAERSFVVVMGAPEGDSHPAPDPGALKRTRNMILRCTMNDGARTAHQDRPVRQGHAGRADSSGHHRGDR